MKVIHITSDYLYNIGGIYQHIENITEFLSKTNQIIIIYLNKNNIEKHIIDEKGRKIYFISNNGSKLTRFLDYPIKKIEKILEQENPDLIHIHTLFEAFRIKKFNKTPMIFTNHSSSYLKMYNNFFLQKLVLPGVLKKFSLIICPSTELYNKTAHLNKLMISNGVNTNRFSETKRNNVNKGRVFEKLGLKFSNQIIAISTRRLFDKNGVLDFIKSNINYFSEMKSELIYIIVGDGEHYSAIKEIIEKNNLNNLLLLGKKDNSELDDLYYISDLCIIPSKMEAISISALEAMASGTVVIANEVGGLKELIDNEITGIFLRELSLKAAIKTFESKSSFIKNNAGTLIKEKYSWDKIALQTENEYLKIINKSKF